MSTPFSFIGAADCYIDVLTDEGVPTGLELKGNCTSFVPKPDSERKEQIATGRANWGQVLASVTIPKPMTATVTFNQLDQALFAAAFFGTNAAVTQTSGEVTAVAPQEITSIPDKWVEVGKYMISDVVVKDEATGAITYVAGTHYEVNPRLGMIKAIKGAAGGIVDNAKLEISYKYAAVNGIAMSAMTNSNVRIRVKMDGQNWADGRNFITEIYQMRLQPTSEFSLVGEDFAEVTFEGVLEAPSGGTTPMKHIWLS